MGGAYARTVDLLARLGLGTLLSVIATQPFEVSQPIPPEPPFWAMQWHARLGAYRTLDVFRDLEPVAADAPGKRQILWPEPEPDVVAPSWACATPRG